MMDFLNRIDKTILTLLLLKFLLEFEFLRVGSLQGLTYGLKLGLLKQGSGCGAALRMLCLAAILSLNCVIIKD